MALEMALSSARDWVGHWSKQATVSEKGEDPSEARGSRAVSREEAVGTEERPLEAPPPGVPQPRPPHTSLSLFHPWLPLGQPVSTEVSYA